MILNVSLCVLQNLSSFKSTGFLVAFLFSDAVFTRLLYRHYDSTLSKMNFLNDQCFVEKGSFSERGLKSCRVAVSQ